MITLKSHFWRKKLRFCYYVVSNVVMDVFSKRYAKIFKNGAISPQRRRHDMISVYIVSCCRFIFQTVHAVMKTVHCRMHPVAMLSILLIIGVILTLVGFSNHISEQRTGLSVMPVKNRIGINVLTKHTRNTRKNVTIPQEIYDIKDKIAQLAIKIYNAKKHARGIKTSDSLTAAVHLVDSILENLSIDPGPLRKRNIGVASSVCPEEYKGSTYGYPFFYKGFEVKNCEYGKHITDLVTVVAYIKSLDSQGGIAKAVETFVRSVYSLHRNMSLVIAANVPKQTANKFTKEFPNLIFKDTIRGWKAGKVWNMLIDAVNTKYAFVARNVAFLTNDARFERLIREIENLHLAAGGGAFRTPDGHWTNGCHQMAMRNYSLTYGHGYDESIQECLICDYIEGPFIASTETLKNVSFKNFEESSGLFEDWFLRLNQVKKEVAVCPDVMFNTFKTAQERAKWDLFLIDWDLYRVQTPLGQTILSKCNRGVAFSNTKATSQCGLNLLTNAIKFIMSTCEEENIICELQEGTVLGAMKFNKVLPWERDADITFLSDNYSAFLALRDKFEKSGYRFTDQGQASCCKDNRSMGGKFHIGTTGWNIEMFGQHMMDSEQLIKAGMSPSKVLLDGKWVNVPRNPGLFARNRYGHEIYRHALHWLTLGLKSGWENYNTRSFLKCEEYSHHACLDLFNTDGNLQFKQVMP